MAQITITISSREYSISCEDGQEARILKLASVLDEKAKMLGEGANQVSESMLLAMVGLLIADELDLAKKDGNKVASEPIESERLAGIDKDVSARIKLMENEILSIANKLELL